MGTASAGAGKGLQGAGRREPSFMTPSSASRCRASLGPSDCLTVWSPDHLAVCLTAWLPPARLSYTKQLGLPLASSLPFSRLPALASLCLPGVAMLFFKRFPSLLRAWRHVLALSPRPCLATRHVGGQQACLDPWTATQHSLPACLVTACQPKPAGPDGEDREGRRAGALGACPRHASLRLVACRLKVAGTGHGPGACLGA